MTSNWRDLSLMKSEWAYRGISYDYETITSIKFFHKVTTTSVNSLPTGKSHEVTLTIVTDAKMLASIKGNCSTLVLKLGYHKHIEPIIDLYTNLAHRTFEIRKRRYTDAISKFRIFSYDNAIFSQEGYIKKDNKLLKISIAKITREPFSLSFNGPDPSFTKKIKRALWSNDIEN